MQGARHRAGDAGRGGALPPPAGQRLHPRAYARTSRCAPEQLQVAIIGAGATGTELAAELHKTTRQLVAFGLDRIDPDKDIKINLIEAAPRILPALPERLSQTAARSCSSGSACACTPARAVAEVLPNGVRLAERPVIPAELVVWAAGVKAPDFLNDIGGLETNRAQPAGGARRRCRRRATTTSSRSATAPPAPGPATTARCRRARRPRTSRPRTWPRSCRGASRGEPLADWHYRDFGSLVSLGDYSTVGSLMGKLIGGNLFIEGLFAGLMYKSLYKMHQLALHGWTKVALDTARPHHHAPHRAAGEAALRAVSAVIPADGVMPASRDRVPRMQLLGPGCFATSGMTIDTKT